MGLKATQKKLNESPEGWCTVGGRRAGNAVERLSGRQKQGQMDEESEKKGSSGNNAAVDSEYKRG